MRNKTDAERAKDFFLGFGFTLAVFAGPVGLAFGLMGWVMQTGHLSLLNCILYGCTWATGAGIILGLVVGINVAASDD